MAGSMDIKSLPVTLSTEYKDVSLLLSSVTRGITADTPFYIAALSAFGLLYSSNPRQVEALFEYLEAQLLRLDRGSEVIAENVEAVGFAAHVLTSSRRWGQRLKNHEGELKYSTVVFWVSAGSLSYCRNHLLLGE